MRLIWIALFLFLIQPINSNHLFLNFQGKTVTTVDRSEFESIFDSSVIDAEKYHHFIDKLEQLIYKQPLNASLNEAGSIVSEQLGYKLDRQKFNKAFYTYFFGKGPGTLNIPTISIYPKVDSELLANIRTKQIGHYITYFNSQKKDRVQNITLATKAINNYVLFPGEVFSFNKVVGKRTYEKGYVPAPVIIKGKMAKDYGGGVCQVSSTLFNAVDRAGVQILQRYSHSKEVRYVPPGRDAQVSWYGADFKFKNIHNQPILIRANVYGGSLIITIHSSDDIDGV